MEEIGEIPPHVDATVSSMFHDEFNNVQLFRIRAKDPKYTHLLFDQGQALYDGTLMGQPFRAAIKTFQVAVWRELCADWQQLPRTVKGQLLGQFPALSAEGFEPQAASG